ncbi:MAG: hypothetical protein OXE59_02345 [Bacteroidetes bacterium]|nr:hypothetical protein [Bacteroidota bacterium]
MCQNNHELFEDFSHHAQLWIMALDGSTHEFEKILEHTNQYLRQWTSHGRSIHSLAMLYANQFLMIAGEIPNSQVSGCAIDALVHEIESIIERRHCKVISPMFMFYRDTGGAVNFASRSQFREKRTLGLITHETPVFNLGISTLKELYNGDFERPFEDSVYTQLFPTQEDLI